MGVIDYFERELKRWIEQPEHLLVSHDRAALVPVIKGHEQQQGRTEKIGGYDRSFDSVAEEPIPPSQYQAWLRAKARKLGTGSLRTSP